MGWLFGWGLAYMPSSVNSVKWMRWHNPLAQNSLRCYVQFVEGVFPSELMPGISRWSTAVCWICAQRNALVFFVIFGQWVKPGPGGRVLTVQGKKSVGAGKLNPPTRRSKWVLTLQCPGVEWRWHWSTWLWTHFWEEICEEWDLNLQPSKNYWDFFSHPK